MRCSPLVRWPRRSTRARAHDRGRGPVGHIGSIGHHFRTGCRAEPGSAAQTFPDPAGRGVSGRVLIIVENIQAAWTIVS